MNINIYQTFYNLIKTYIFGGTTGGDANQELILILVSTIATLFIIALPFLVVWKVIRIFMG